MKRNYFKKTVSGLLTAAMMLTIMPTQTVLSAKMFPNDEQSIVERTQEKSMSKERSLGLQRGDVQQELAKKSINNEAGTETAVAGTEIPEKKGEDDFTYDLLEDGTAEITGYQGEVDGDLIIPDSVDGYAVSSIGEFAFNRCGFTGDLIIPESVTSIGAYAFSGCDFTGELKLPERLASIGAYAFNGCDFTGELKLPESLTSIGNGVFSVCGFTGELKLPEKLTSIGGSAFSACGFTGDLIIPESVTSIGGWAFDDCSFTGELKLPENLTSIGECAFRNCNFTGDINLPECIESIGDSAFYSAHVEDILGNFVLSSMPLDMELYVFGDKNYNVFTLDIGTELGVNQTRQGNVIVSGMRLSRPIVTKWISSNESAAKVDENGLITAVSVGEATIRAELYNGKNVESVLKIGTENVEDEQKNYILYTSPERKELQDLWIGDEIFIGAKNGGESCNSSLSSMDVVSGGDFIAVEEIIQKRGKNGNVKYWKIKCNQKGDVKLLIHYKGEVIEPVEVKLNIKERPGDVKATLIIKSLKLGENRFLKDIASYENLSYGARPAVYVNDKDAEKFHNHYASGTGWGGWFPMYLREERGHMLMYLAEHEGTSYANIAGLATYPGTIDLMFYQYPEDFEQGKEPISTNSVVIEEPIIRQNAKEVYYTGEEQKFAVKLENTGYIDAEIGNLTVWDARLYYTPRLEVLSGQECLDLTGEQKITTLTLQQKLRFKKAGLVTLKVTYEPSGEDAPLNQVYRPEKTITIQVKDKNQENIPVTSISLNKKSLDLKKGQNFKLDVSVMPANATNKEITWTTSNPKVAVVSGGKVTAKAPGTAIITAKAADGSGKSASCKVTVGYKITYKLNGGKNNSRNPSVYYKEKIKLKNPSRKGYLFKGWYTDRKYKNKIIKISAKSDKNVTLYAKWEKIKLNKPEITTLKSKSGNKALLRFTGVKKAVGYQVSYAPDRRLKSGRRTITTKSNSLTLKNLQKKKSYYVKVRAYRIDSAGNKVYGKYSSVKRVRINAMCKDN